MKLTKSKLKQLIKEELNKILLNEYRDEWSGESYSEGDRMKYGEFSWFDSHWRDQILNKIKRREEIPRDLQWRRIARELKKAGIFRPGPEADAFIDGELSTMRQENEDYPHVQKDIPLSWSSEV